MFVERFAQAVATWTWQREPPHGKKVEAAVVSRILQYSFVFLLYNVHFLFFSSACLFIKNPILYPSVALPRPCFRSTQAQSVRKHTYIYLMRQYPQA